jgi:hypothetical protein
MVTQETQGILDRFRPLEDNSPTSYVLVLLMAIDVVIIVAELVLTSSWACGVPLPILLYPRGARLEGR